MKRNFINFIVFAVLLIVATVACDRDKAVTSVTVEPETLELIAGERVSLNAKVEPTDAANRAVTWSSDNELVATVGMNGLVTAVDVGTAIITATTEDGGFTSTCTVTVIPLPDPVDPFESMVFVEGGTFTMGGTSGDELPTFQVRLSSYFISKYPVTQKEWRAIMRDNPSHFKGENLPVENVAWDDIELFLEALNKLYRPNDTVIKYRLATEAEWEYAARGGKLSNGYKFSGSNTVGEVAWYSGNSAIDNNPRLRQTHPVGTKVANELGIFDMSGNVWEWCSDWYGSYSDTTRTGYNATEGLFVNPQGPAVGVLRVARGGSWMDFEERCRVVARYGPTPPPNSFHLGFRIVLSAEPRR